MQKADTPIGGRVIFPWCKKTAERFRSAVDFLFLSDVGICEKLGRCELFVAPDGEETNENLTCRAREEEDLCAGERKSENVQNAFSHEARKYRTDHHTEERGKVRKNGMEGKVIRAVLFGEVNVRERRHDGVHNDAQNVLREAYGYVKPDGICRYEGVCKIRCSLHEQAEAARTEPIMLGDELFPHRREEDEEKEIRCIDAVTKRVADADIENVSVKGCVGKVGNEGVGRCDQDRAKKTLVFEGKRENIGKLGFRCGCVRKFLRNEPDQTVDHRKEEGDISNGRQHEKLVRCTHELVTDEGNDECDGKRNGAVDTAGCGEVVHTHVIRQEVCVPCGEAGTEKLVDGACRDSQDNEADQQRRRIFHNSRKDRDTKDIDRVCEQLTCHKDTLALFEMLEKPWGEDIKKTSKIRNEGKDTDIGNPKTVVQKKACVEKTAGKLTDKTRHDARHEHTEASATQIIFDIVNLIKSL